MADAFVLAAGEAHGQLAEMGGTRLRALIKVQGRPMIEHVLRALRGARRVQRILVVGPPQVQERLPGKLADLVVLSGETLLESLERGLEALGTSGAVMFAHSDAPLVTAAAFDDFLERAEPQHPDLAWAIVPREVMEEKYPHGHRTYARTREGTFTGTNVVLVNTRFIRAHPELVRQFYHHRKNPLRLARMLGAGLLLRLLTGRLSLSRLEQRLGQVVGGRARAIISHYPELAFDVDKPEDLHVIRSILGE